MSSRPAPPLTHSRHRLYKSYFRLKSLLSLNVQYGNNKHALGLVVLKGFGDIRLPARLPTPAAVDRSSVSVIGSDSCPRRRTIRS